MFFDKLKKSFVNLFNNKKCYICNLKHQYTISIDPYHYYRIFLNKNSRNDDFNITTIETKNGSSTTLYEVNKSNFDDALKEFFHECDRIKNIVAYFME